MSSSAPKLCVADVSMTFKTPTGAFHALAPITLSIPQGRFVSLIGPSGCGKSTIFNIIAGLLGPTGGRVLIDGVDATGTIGRVGYMLQKDLLLSTTSFSEWRFNTCRCARRANEHCRCFIAMGLPVSNISTRARS